MKLGKSICSEKCSHTNRAHEAQPSQAEKEAALADAHAHARWVGGESKGGLGMEIFRSPSPSPQSRPNAARICAMAKQWGNYLGSR